jgi:hypothetical protein
VPLTERSLAEPQLAMRPVLTIAGFPTPRRRYRLAPLARLISLFGQRWLMGKQTLMVAGCREGLGAWPR